MTSHHPAVNFLGLLLCSALGTPSSCSAYSMAKEVDLKRVELKVSVNCCEGCKRKVLKALSIRGVLRTEIHPTQPKVTVTGDVDAGVLIKRLAKVGKAAELMAEEAKPQGEGLKCSEAPEKKPEKPNDKKEKDDSVDSGSKADENKRGEKERSDAAGPAKVSPAEAAMKSDHPAAVVATVPQLSCMVSYPSMAAHGGATGVYYPVEPVRVPVPCYGFPVPAPCCVQSHHHCQMPPPPAMQSQATAFGDYFNEENTVGCRVM